MYHLRRKVGERFKMIVSCSARCESGVNRRKKAQSRSSSTTTVRTKPLLQIAKKSTYANRRVPVILDYQQSQAIGQYWIVSAICQNDEDANTNHRTIRSLKANPGNQTILQSKDISCEPQSCARGLSAIFSQALSKPAERTQVGSEPSTESIAI